MRTAIAADLREKTMRLRKVADGIEAENAQLSARLADLKREAGCHEIELQLIYNAYSHKNGPITEQGKARILRTARLVREKTDLENEFDNSKKRIEALRTEVERLQGLVSNAPDRNISIESLEEELDLIGRKVKAATKREQKLTKAIRSTEAKLEREQAEVEDASQVLEEAKQKALEIEKLQEEANAISSKIGEAGENYRAERTAIQKIQETLSTITDESTELKNELTDRLPGAKTEKEYLDKLKFTRLKIEDANAVLSQSYETRKLFNDRATKVNETITESLSTIGVLIETINAELEAALMVNR